MRSILFVFAALMVSAQAGAKSLSPCAPIVKAEPTRLSCRDGEDIYTIVINTLMSRPIAQCQGSNHYETQTASVTRTDRFDRNRGTLQIYEGDFKYSLSGASGASFSSSKYRLELRDCVSPINGGVISFGN